MNIKNSIVTGGDTWEHRIEVLRSNLADGSWDYLFLTIILTYIEADNAHDYERKFVCKELLAAYEKKSERDMLIHIGTLERLYKERI